MLPLANSFWVLGVGVVIAGEQLLGLTPALELEDATELLELDFELLELDDELDDKLDFELLEIADDELKDELDLELFEEELKDELDLELLKEPAEELELPSLLLAELDAALDCATELTELVTTTTALLMAELLSAELLLAELMAVLLLETDEDEGGRSSP